LLNIVLGYIFLLFWWVISNFCNFLFSICTS